MAERARVHDPFTPHSAGRFVRSWDRHRRHKDVETLLFLRLNSRQRTPAAVLRELKGIVDDYPDATAEAKEQETT